MIENIRRNLLNLSFCWTIEGSSKRQPQGTKRIGRVSCQKNKRTNKQQQQQKKQGWNGVSGSIMNKIAKKDDENYPFTFH